MSQEYSAHVLTSERLVLCLTKMSINLLNIQSSPYQEYTAMAQVGNRRNAHHERNYSLLLGDYDSLQFKLKKV